ncbi:MAG: GHKL domain-containing protein [Ignavibacteriales bacterium]
MLAGILGSGALSVAIMYVWFVLYGEKIDFRKPRIYIIYASLSIGLILNYFYSTMALKVTTAIILLGIFNWLLFRKNLRAVVISTILTEAIVFTAETIFSLIVIISIPKADFKTIMESYFGVLFTNVIISFIIIFIIQFNFVKRLYNKLLKSTNKIKVKQLTIIVLFLVMSYNLIFFNTYNQSNFLTVMIINTSLIVIYSIITFKMIKNNNNYLDISSKYGTALDCLKEYETMLDQYKVCNHENKNQLLTIRSMIVKKEKSIPKYIDSVINEKIEDDEKLMFETTIIPEGGLRAIIYSKILYMKKNNINFFINVDKKIRTVDFIGLGDKLAYDVCRIVSVYLDNAIDAVLPNKDGSISIEFYIDDKCLCIAISNTFTTINLDRIDEMGYTTKNDGHGYGLPLVKEILIKNSSILKNERKITNDVFTQILRIKIN